MLRGLKIEMFWDGSSKAAVSVPFGDFFGMALGHMTALHSGSKRHGDVAVEDSRDERKRQGPSALLLRHRVHGG
jgi:hypothetical protein